MPALPEIAYPRLKPVPTDRELDAWFTPVAADLAFADRHTRRGRPEAANDAETRLGKHLS